MFARIRVIVTLFAAFAVLVAFAPSALAQKSADSNRNFSDNLKFPQGMRQQKLQMEALRAKMEGEPVGDVYRTADGAYVEAAKIAKDSIWTILGEFSNQVDPNYGGTAGPQRNQIPEPDRTLNNTTIWIKNFSKKHYERLLFSKDPNDSSMRNYYLEQSSGRYTVRGEVTDWVQVPYNEAYYGSDYCGDIVCQRTWLFLQDAANGWYQAQLAAGKTPDQINTDLSQFDVWDRYDYDGDGNFNEPDGYIDHFQAIHAGEGQETGGGAQGTDAIWSHRWYAFYSLIGSAGPTGNPFGGFQIGNSNYWIGDYTIEPENGGVGVFSHEFGHDLGLPDLYDTSGNTGGAENSTGFWTIMSQGSYGNTGKPKDGIGDNPVDMSAYEKLYLGWATYRNVRYGYNADITLGPSYTQSDKAQVLIVNLPDKQLVTNVGSPYAGSYFYYSGKGNDLDNSMTRDVTLPAGGVSLSAYVDYDIEQDWDYAYLTVNGTNVHTNLSTASDPNGQNFGEGITGSSGGYVQLTADLSAYAGQQVSLGFRYWTDGATVGDGLRVDDIAITGQPTDGAETDPGWDYAGFTRTNGTATESFFNAYLAEYRIYRGYDKALQTGPYNFGFLNDQNKQDWVEHFPYQDGLLIWYYDTSFEDNNIGDHCLDNRCGGLYLPIDSHPNLLMRPDGTVWRPRVQAYDSTFGLDNTDAICLHLNSVEQCYKSRKPQKVFNDNKSYWVAPDPSVNNKGYASVIVPHTGTKITVTAINNVHIVLQVRFTK